MKHSERVGKSVFPSVTRSKRANRIIHCEISRKFPNFGFFFHILKTVNFQQLKGMNVLNYCRYVKGVKYKVYRTGTFLVKNRK